MTGDTDTGPVLRVIVTGTRNALTPEQVSFIQRKLTTVCGPARSCGAPVVIVHGRCHKGGVDLIAERWAEQTSGVTQEPHPADWNRHGIGAGMIRNTEMVALGAAICLAFPARGSRGTWDCLKKAADAGIPGRVYPL